MGGSIRPHQTQVPSSLASSNIFPEHALADGHDFQMFSFEDTTSCRACQMLLR